MQILIRACLTELRVVLCSSALVAFSTGQGGVIQMLGGLSMTAIYISRADVYAWVVLSGKRERIQRMRV